MASTNKDYLKHYIFHVERVNAGQIKGAACDKTRSSSTSLGPRVEEL